MIIFLGSPLLDIVAYVDKEFLNKYHLKPDSTTRATPELLPIFKDILKFKPIHQPGGSVVNTARVFQWISQKSYPLVSVGCIGEDEDGELLRQKIVEEEIHCDYFEIDNEHTGKVAVLLTEEDRTMVSALGASTKFSESLLNDHLWEHFNQAEFFYVSAHSLGFCSEVAKKIMDYFNENNKKVIINLAARFLSQKYPKDLTYFFDHSDIVFGNEREYRGLYEIHSDEECLTHELLRKLNSLFPSKPARLLVMTRGKEPLYILADNNLKEFETLPISHDKIVDTNTAGDAFAGGFLAKYVQNKSIYECVNCGLWSSREIIQHQGCSFDKNKIYSN